MIALLIIAAVVVLLVWSHKRDVKNCARVNAPRAGMAIASRAATLDDCPEAFIAKVLAVLADDGDEPPVAA